MSNANKALLAGFVIGAVILGAVGLLLAPHLLAMAGVAIGHAAIQTTAVTSTVPVLIGTPSTVVGVTAAAFGYLQAGIAVGMGLLGGLAGGLIGFASSKKENNHTLQHTSSSSVAPINNKKINGDSPSLDIDGQDTAKSFVQHYEQEKLASLQAPPNQWRQ